MSSISEMKGSGPATIELGLIHEDPREKRTGSASAPMSSSITAAVDSVAARSLLPLHEQCELIFREFDPKAFWKFDWRSACTLIPPLMNACYSQGSRDYHNSSLQEDLSFLQEWINTKPGAILNQAPLDKFGNIRTNSGEIEDDCVYVSLLQALLKVMPELVESEVWKDQINSPDTFRKAIVKWMKDAITTNELLQEYVIGGIQDYLFFCYNTYVSQCKIYGNYYRDNYFDYPTGEGDRLWKEAREELIKMGDRNWDLRKSLNTPEEYFNLVEKSPFFISFAELYAISEMFKISIRVTRAIGSRPSYENVFAGRRIMSNTRFPLIKAEDTKLVSHIRNTLFTREINPHYSQKVVHLNNYYKTNHNCNEDRFYCTIDEQKKTQAKTKNFFFKLLGLA